MTLTEFLLARIAEDQATADQGWWVDTLGPDGPTAPWHPARVLAECEAKRRIVAECAAEFARSGPDTGEGDLAEWVLGSLATPYKGHPDYDEAWRRP